MAINTCNVNAFIQELKVLQAKYGISICADYNEDWDYDWDDNPICIGAKATLALHDIHDNYYSLDTDEIYM